MIKEDIQYYFDQALQLPPNQKLVIPAGSEKEAESIRVTLYRIKREYQLSCPSDKSSITVSRETRHGNFLVVLEKSPAPPPAFIIDEHGNVKEQIHVPEGLVKVECEPEEDKEAIADAMRRDGVAEDVINKLLKEEG